MHSTPLKVIYIVGAGRSGSTLLERMIGVTPGLLPAGEIKYIWERGFANNELCSCGQPFLQCGFWSRVIEDAFGSHSAVPYDRLIRLREQYDRIRFIPSLRFQTLRTRSFENRLSELQEALTSLYRSIITVSGARAIIDSSKLPSYGFLLATIPTFELYTIHLVRDSRAVAYSWAKTVIRPEVTTRTAYMGRFSATATARRWNSKNVLSEALRPSSRQYVRIRYEDLVGNPGGEIARILRATGDCDGRPLTNEEPRTVELPPTYHTVSGNPVRFEHDSVRIRLDDEWRAGLPPSMKRRVTALTFPLLLRYGYRLGRFE